MRSTTTVVAVVVIAAVLVVATGCSKPPAQKIEGKGMQPGGGMHGPGKTPGQMPGGAPKPPPAGG